MSQTTLEDDLAFLRSLADGDVARAHQLVFGKTYAAAGLLYGIQVALLLVKYWGLGELPFSEGALMLVTNAAFLGYLAWIVWRHRGIGAGTATNKAINAVFQAVGMANLAVLVILFAGAFRLNEPMLGALIPAVIFALQGV